MWLNRLTARNHRLFGLKWKFRLEAEEPVPDRGPLIMAQNHVSYLDPWYLIWFFPRLPIHHLMNQAWHERTTFWNLFFRANGTVPVVPNEPEATLAAVRAVLDKQRAICIFPEGGISKDGTLQRFRSGIGWFAAALDVPVYPMAILGARESLPKGVRYPKSGTITLRVGKPMRYPNPGPKPSRKETLAFTHEVRQEVLRLTGAGATESATDPA